MLVHIYWGHQQNFQLTHTLGLQLLYPHYRVWYIFEKSPHKSCSPR